MYIIIFMRNERKTGHLLTEKINSNTTHIDSSSTDEIFDLICNEDEQILSSIRQQKKNIVDAIELIILCLRSVGRLIFVGAGTSGRLGVMESAECPPTFGTEPDLIKGIIAGGKEALMSSIEGAEDSTDEAVKELESVKLCDNDIVVGIAASLNTPFVESALIFAKEIGCKTVLITCNSGNPDFSDVTINLMVGPEVIVGSTRMKAGTATKMVLNILTTASMVRMGKTYGNLMVDVQPSSAKLKDRAKRIVIDLTGVDESEAEELLEKSDWDVKASIVMKNKNVDLPEAKNLLAEKEGFLKKVIS